MGDGWVRTETEEGKNKSFAVGDGRCDGWITDLFTDASQSRKSHFENHLN
jgi:hypothetical protein